MNRALDLEQLIPGLSGSTESFLSVGIDPSVHLTLGILLVPDDELPTGDDAPTLFDRIYVTPSSELTLDYDVSWNGGQTEASIGFLDVLLGSDGIDFSGNAGFRLNDDDGDGRIPLSELLDINLSSADGLPSVFEPFVNGDLAANLQLEVNVGDTATIPPVSIDIAASFEGLDEYIPFAEEIYDQIAAQASGYLDFNSISADMILEMVPRLIAWLRDLGVGGLLDEQLPLLNKSLADLVQLGTEFGSEIASPTAAVVRTASALGAFLGAETTVHPDEILFQFQLEHEHAEKLPFSFGVEEAFDFLPVTVEGDGQFRVEADVLGQVTLGIIVADDSDLSTLERFFVDTDNSRLELNANANIGGYDPDHPPLNFHIDALGRQFGVEQARGMASLGAGATIQDLPDGPGDDLHRLTLLEMAEDGFTVDAWLGQSPSPEIGTGDQIQLVIPINGDGRDMAGFSGTLFTPSLLEGTGDAVIEVFGKLSDLPNGIAFNSSLPMETHDVGQLLTAQELAELGDQIVVRAYNLDGFIANGPLNLDSLFSGLRQFIEFADQLLGTGVLDFELPFIGKSIRDAVDEGINFVGQLECPEGVAPTTLGQVVGCIVEQGVSGGFANASKLADFLEGVPGITQIGALPFLETTGPENDPDSLTFQFAFTPGFSVSLAQGFDLGVDFLSLRGESMEARFDGSLRMLVGFGIDKQHGFFIKTDFGDDDEPEIQLNATLALEGSAALKLGFVEMAAHFGDGEDNYMTTGLGLDLDGGEDGRLEIGELIGGRAISQTVNSDALSFSVDTELNVPLRADVTVGGDHISLITTTLVVDWDFDNQSGVTVPSITLKDISVPVGDIVNTIGGGILGAVRKYNPLTPILDDLGKPLPVIGKSILELIQEMDPSAADSPILALLTTLEQLNNVSEFNLSFGDVLILEDRDGKPKMGGDGFSLTGYEPDGDAKKKVKSPPLEVPGGGIEILGIGDALVQLYTDYGIKFPILDLGNLFSFLIAKQDVDLVFFDPPTPLRAGLYFGDSTPFAAIGIPGIVEVNAKASFVVGVGLEVDLTFGLDTRGFRDRSPGIPEGNDLGFFNGFWIGDFHPGFDGEIGPDDLDIPEVGLGGLIEASIDGSAALLGFEVARLRGFGRISADVGINLNDDNRNRGTVDLREPADRFDGKFHLDEMATVVQDHCNNPLCLFDLTGGLRAAVGAEIKVDLGFLGSISESFDKNIPIVDFELACPPSRPPDLLAQLDGTVLTLTGTPSDADEQYRQTAGTNHPDGDQIEFLLVDKDGANGVETLRVKKGGVIEDFGPFEQPPDEENGLPPGPNYIQSGLDISAIQGPIGYGLPDYSLGAGPDRITFDPAIQAVVLFDGGPGDDELITTAAGGVLYGGEGNDVLEVFVADDEDEMPIVCPGEFHAILVGGGGDDVIIGGPCRDQLVGDYLVDPAAPPVERYEGRDFIDSGGNATAESELIWGDNRFDALDSEDGPPPDATRRTDDRIVTRNGTALVFAGAGNDLVIVDPRTDADHQDATDPGTATVYGGTGNDLLKGGGGDDVLIGQAGDDILEGGEGNDALFGGNVRDLTVERWPGVPSESSEINTLGNDQLFGHGGNDLLDGYDSTFVVAYGADGDDTIIGSLGNDLLYGDTGDDVIAAGPGSDLARGGVGNDAILGGSGGIDGETLWPLLTQSLQRPDRTDRLFGDDGNDIIMGDNGRIRDVTVLEDISNEQLVLSRIRTESRTLSVFGEGSTDLIVGGKGDDYLFGGEKGDNIFGDSDFVYFQGFVPVEEVAPDPGNDVIIGDAGVITVEEYTAVYDYPEGDEYDRYERETIRTIQSLPSFSESDGDFIAADELTVTALGGNDVVFGGEGGDRIRGDAGHDYLFGDLAVDYVRDWYALDLGNSLSVYERYIESIEEDFGDSDLIHGGTGRDVLVGGVDGDQLFGDDDRDYIFGDLARVSFSAADGWDRITSIHVDQGGVDMIDGGLGDDFLVGGADDDTIWAGDDVQPVRNFLVGDGGTVVVNSPTNLTLYAYAEDGPVSAGGDDTIYGQGGNDYIAAGPGEDEVRGGDGNDLIYGDVAIFFEIEPGSTAVLRPGDHTTFHPEVGASDVLYADGGMDQVYGGAGDDFLSGVANENQLFGDDGLDTVFEQGDVDFTLDDHLLDSIMVVNHLTSIERAYLTGGESANVIDAVAFSGETTLAGQAGNDTLLGGINDDWLFGDQGSDLLCGGPGDDLLIGGDVSPDASDIDEDDDLYGGEGDDRLYGVKGDDFLDGGPGHDQIHGGDGDNTHLALWNTGIVPDGLYHTFTVVDTADFVDGSLRWAIDEADALAGDVLVVVDFQIPTHDVNFLDVDSGTGGDPEPDVFFIRPTIDLPPLTRGNVVINGLSQTGFLEVVDGFANDPNPAGPDIVLDGRALLANGLQVSSDNNELYGLNIRQFQQSGILVEGNRNLVAANYIGTDATGAVPRPNLGDGVRIVNGDFNRIGSLGLENVISGNVGYGIAFSGDAMRNTVLGNYIGTDGGGTLPLGNAVAGVLAAGLLNQIGTVATPHGNVIAFNGTGILAAAGLGNRFQGNSIHSNMRLGIDLGGDGVTQNDLSDSDSGPNRRQNFPEIQFASAGSQTRVAGILQSSQGALVQLDFYASSVADSTGYGEGARYLGATTVETDLFGIADFEVFLDSATQPTEWITATATNTLTRDTSEFSQAYRAADDVDVIGVVNTNDSGPGSLRAAIEFVNALPPGEATQIVFRIPPDDPGFVDIDIDMEDGDPERDVFVISPLASLPDLTRDAVIIDGSTQTLSTGDTNPVGPEIVLNGADAGASTFGLRIFSDGNHINELNIHSFAGNGVEIHGSDNRVTGSFIGTDPTGSEDRGNLGIGLFVIDAADNVVENNLVSGNEVNGVVIGGSAATRNTVQGNRIGTDRTGTTAIGNTLGVHIADAPGNFIETNVISGNLVGVVVSGEHAVGNQVRGNFIGTDLEGSAALGNRADGVFVDHAPGNTFARNVIAASGFNGVLVVGAAGNELQGNFIGTDMAGTISLGNARSGVSLVDSSDTIIGGTTAAERNVIADNFLNGVSVTGVTARDNQILGNYIGTNALGTATLGYQGHGVRIEAPHNTVGRDEPGAGNVISGNVHGVTLIGEMADDNTVSGNLIGTDAGGTVALGNELDGILVWNGAERNRIGGTDDDARNVIAGAGRYGIWIRESADETLIQGNYLGTDASGSVPLANVGSAIYVDNVANTTIGGSEAGAGNVLSTSQNGINIRGGRVVETVIQGNYIGTDVTGTLDLGNRYDGILVGYGYDAAFPFATQIGGTTPQARNVISNNRRNGITIAEGGGNVIQGNYIGTDASGTQAMGNASRGIYLVDSRDNLIGGSTPGSRNVISANVNVGIAIEEDRSTGNKIQGNYIGVDESGTIGLGNGASGVSITYGASGNFVGADGDAIGDGAEGNVISAHTGPNTAGVHLGGDDNVVAGNLIGTDATGTAAIGNQYGVWITGSTGNVIGGASPEYRNIISGNLHTGVAVDASTDNTIIGNYVGTDISGSLNLGNRAMVSRLTERTRERETASAAPPQANAT